MQIRQRSRSHNKQLVSSARKNSMPEDDENLATPFDHFPRKENVSNKIRIWRLP
jgi:hypothetical protein